MTRENASAKAKRYLCEGKVIIQPVANSMVAATVRGDGELYRLGWTPSTGWRCACPARTDQCAHLIAVHMVAAVDIDGGQVP